MVRRRNSTYRLRYWNSTKVRPPAFDSRLSVATVLTVYGIETTAIVNTANFFISRNSTYRLRYWNFAIYINLDWWYVSVATVLTVYGIETYTNCHFL